MTKRLTIALVALAMFVLVAIMPVSALSYKVVNTSINRGATVFIGEQSLNLSPALDTFYVNGGSDKFLPTKIGWWASAAGVLTTAPTKSYDIVWPGINNTAISYTAFGSYYGPWYAVDINTGFGNTTGGAIINVQDPQISVDIIDFDQNAAQGGTSMSGKTVIQGDKLGFKIGTNMDTAVSQPTLRTHDITDATDTAMAWANIRVKTDQGNIFSALLNGSTVTGGGTVPLTERVVDTPVWTWGSPSINSYAANPGNWSTAATDSTGQLAYPAGTYTVYVESALNGMYDGYQLSGAAYTGKTVSASQTVTLASNTVKITSNKDTVVRSKPFSITVTGRPNTGYTVWVKGTSTMSGAYDNQPPMFVENQVGVTNDTAYMASDAATVEIKNFATTGAGLNGYYFGTIGSWIGGYVYQNGGGTSTSDGTVWSDVAHGGHATGDTSMVTLGNGTRLYGNVTTGDSGTRTIELMTTNWTKAQKYTIRVEHNFGTVNLRAGAVYKSDEVDITVEKGTVTIVAAGDQSYYLGEEVKFSGTNTESATTYLFISGPNLKEYGSNMNQDPRNEKAGGDLGTDITKLVSASVAGDNTWSYKWGTSSIALDAGTYTIWATSQPSNNDPTLLANVAYGTVSVIIKKPFISATASQSTIAQGDKLLIVGTAEGSPSVGVQIWILGKNYVSIAQKSVNADASFSQEITRSVTTNLYPGQYFVVAQHPMQNNVFDIYAGTAVAAKSTDVTQTLYVYNNQLTAAGAQVFKLTNTGSLQGSDAAEALVQAINDPNVDDTYTKLQFLVENPTITIVPVGDRHVGDKFTIVAATNLAVDDDVLCQVYSSSFKPTQKTQSGEFSGTSATVKVTKGDTGLNKVSFDVDASTFKPDEYIVQEDGVLVSATGTALFNVLEGAAPTAVPTKVVTVVVPTTAAPITVPPTTVATPTKTPTQPGFGALVALIGLGAVAFLVVRRH